MWSLAAADPDGTEDTTMVVMDQEMERYHRETGLAAVAYSSQGQGLFHRMAAGTLDHMDRTARGMYEAEANRARFERIERLRTETGLSLTQIVLGYLLSQPFASIPIVGCRTEEQLRDSLSAAGVRLDPDQLRYLEDGEVG
jgi:aryl-alcohol dehydrogenase-like predicted oxidoreductase